MCVCVSPSVCCAEIIINPKLATSFFHVFHALNVQLGVWAMPRWLLLSLVWSRDVQRHPSWRPSRTWEIPASLCRSAARVESQYGRVHSHEGTPKWMENPWRIPWKSHKNGWLGGTPILGILHMVYWYLLMFEYIFEWLQALDNFAISHSKSELRLES